MPKGIRSTGFPATEATCRQIGLEFDPWQRDLNRAVLGKARDGSYAADTVVMSIPRQVGKTFDVGALVFADSIINPGTTTVWTAHRFKVARESFNEMRAWAKRPELRPHIDFDAITTAAGNECIPFRNGSRIVFAARERGAIRGFTKVRRLVLDEGQILTDAALSDLIPTMNQAVNPQIIVMGTPPKPSDPSEVFTRLRAEALSGDADGALFVEFSADPNADPDDKAAWAKANPSYPHRTPTKAMQRMRRLLSDEDFLREALGIWDAEDSEHAIPKAGWAETLDPDASMLRVDAFGVDVSPDRAWASVGAVGVTPTGKTLLEHVQRGRRTGWLVARCLELDEAHGPAEFVVDGTGPAASLIADLENAGLRVTVASSGDVAKACGRLVDAIGERVIVHGPQPELNAAAEGARRRKRGDAFVFGRGNSLTDITPLYAVTLAFLVRDSSNYDVALSIY